MYPTAEQLLASPATSDWLRSALADALKRDPVNASNDADVLAAVLGARATATVVVEMAKLGISVPFGTWTPKSK